ncbi:hypothetical protein BGW38_002891 [Lunasporangiospora selenospora]|uniref:Large ribosomal subunit protein mL44 n=1 Tax=Lunasporangiospora selenospora TaxID=979761 RepID=A0A9P6KHN0_9FUNG|nr:hypothetical protein BGW38_002891 [Lunasporangiospora selenospora]
MAPLVRTSSRVALTRAVPPVFARTFLIDLKSTRTPKSKDEKTAAASSESTTASSTPTLPYRIEEIPPAVSAFSHRLGLNTLNDQTLLMRVVTHPSYERAGIKSNERLDYLGDRVIDMYVLEHLHIKYPKLPLEVLREAAYSYTRKSTVALMAKEFGIPDVARWTHSKPEMPYQLPAASVHASVVRAIVGAIYTDQGPIKARQFIHAHFLSREFDIKPLIKIDDPKLNLSFLMKRLNRERPVARLQAETGRQSKAPVFIVGVYSGKEKLGEGFGSSLKMAEFRANMDALTKYYLEEVKDHGLPSDKELDGVSYIPTKVGDTQVIV